MLFTTSILVTMLPLLAKAVPLSKRSSNQYIFRGVGQAGVAQCLGVQLPITDGSPIITIDCGATDHLTEWDISAGNNAAGVVLSGTGYCIDSTTGTVNNTPLKVWTCYPGLVQQTFYYTGDAHIAVTGTNQCVDVGPAGPQTYQCVGGNTNQIFYLSGTTGGSTTTVTTSATATTSAPSVTTTTTGTVPTPSGVNTGVQISFNGSSTGCLTTGHGNIVSGGVVYINGCDADPIDDTSYYGISQLWTVTRNVAGPIKLANVDNLCLDAGVNPNTNGSPITVYTCLQNPDGTPIAQQNWFVTEDDHIALTGLSQCLDVVRDSAPTENKPDGSLQDVSTWQCSGTDVQQLFTLI